ncbi:hypothetical protein [Pelagicoccus sp. SDUM812005]|uniref:hypothetical protein n=1 Tax=Pelagicoccus sp. SDUM812005 TaxID=3041257 RepID=UPI002810837D|nr:hypothetical protein [Pelagicoccus sp. SDUM812005]MDQ8181689.1 hypothetical protein [Pelagicoccus sp. SDUM812005]
MAFEKGISKLGPEEKKRTISAINRLGHEVSTQGHSHNIKLLRPLSIKLTEGLDSTLYVYRATPKVRIVLTIDPDPLFEQTIVTLLRVVSHDGMKKAFSSMADSIYQKKLLELEDND